MREKAFDGQIVIQLVVRWRKFLLQLRKNYQSSKETVKGTPVLSMEISSARYDKNFTYLKDNKM